MAYREIKHYKKDDVLRKKSRPVDKFDDKLAILIDDMIETMYKADGIGLAAPQVGILKRVIVIDIGEGIIELVNPEFVCCSGQQQELEGCLSVPGLSGMVERPIEVLVRGFNRKGELVELKATGLLARALCHEIDHLNGVLFIDIIIPGTLEG